MATRCAVPVSSFAETDLALTRVGITADASDKQIRDLDQTVWKTAFDTGNSFDKVTKGLKSFVAGGIDLDKALPAIPAIAKTAQAAGAEVEDMATTTLALNQALGIGTDKMQGAFDVLEQHIAAQQQRARDGSQLWLDRVKGAKLPPLDQRLNSPEIRALRQQAFHARQRLYRGGDRGETREAVFDPGEAKGWKDVDDQRKAAADFIKLGGGGYSETEPS